MADIYLPTLRAKLTVWSDSRSPVECGSLWSTLGKTFMLSSAAVTYATSQFRRPAWTLSWAAGWYLHCRISPVSGDLRQAGRNPAAAEKSFSRQEKRLLLKNGGKIDFWVTNDNKLAGRGREYEIILIDEAAFTKSPEMLKEIWPKSIKPTLLTTKGRAYVFSTPDGVDEENFFYAICHNKDLGFHEHHAPTSSNPSFLSRSWRKSDRTTTLAFSGRSSPPSSSTGPLRRCSTSANGLRVKTRISLSITLRCARPSSLSWIPPLRGGTEHDGTAVVYRRRHRAGHSATDHSRLGCGADRRRAAGRVDSVSFHPVE